MSGHSTSKPREGRAAIGVRSHSGWAAYVVLRGDSEEPDILARGRMELCDPSIKGSKQPYHEAEPMTFPAASAFITRCRDSTEALAIQAVADISRLAGSLRGCCILTASGRPLPGLEQVLLSHALIHSAEGEFYRNALVAACEARNIPVQRVRERELEVAADALPGSQAMRAERLEAWGQLVGAPWRQDEKMAALAAWLALAGGPPLRMPRSRAKSRVNG
jgi:hypothetical protein